MKQSSILEKLKFWGGYKRVVLTETKSNQIRPFKMSKDPTERKKFLAQSGLKYLKTK
jgi:hypothetical protein